jgi:hypothetical protein
MFVIVVEGGKTGCTWPSIDRKGNGSADENRPRSSSAAEQLFDEVIARRWQLTGHLVPASSRHRCWPPSPVSEANLVVTTSVSNSMCAHYARVNNQERLVVHSEMGQMSA